MLQWADSPPHITPKLVCSEATFKTLDRQMHYGKMSRPSLGSVGDF